MSDLYWIIQNGLERNWQLPEIKQSLLNAGYSPQDIDFEFKSLQAQPAQPLPTIQTQNKMPTQSLKNYQTPILETNSSRKKTMIVIFIISALFLVLGTAVFLLLLFSSSSFPSFLAFRIFSFTIVSHTD